MKENEFHEMCEAAKAVSLSTIEDAARFIAIVLERLAARTDHVAVGLAYMRLACRALMDDTMFNMGFGYAVAQGWIEELDHGASDDSWIPDTKGARPKAKPWLPHLTIESMA